MASIALIALIIRAISVPLGGYVIYYPSCVQLHEGGYQIPLSLWATGGLETVTSPLYPFPGGYILELCFCHETIKNPKHSSVGTMLRQNCELPYCMDCE